jgi:hypothetical protein
VEFSCLTRWEKRKRVKEAVIKQALVVLRFI